MIFCFQELHCPKVAIERDVCRCSVEGISATATVVETLCYTVIVGYNLNHVYPFSSFGDVFACWLQDIVVCALLVWYKNPPVSKWAPWAALFMVFNFWVISGMCGMQVLLWLQVRALSGALHWSLHKSSD